MKYIQLKHDACLKMPKGKALLKLPQSALSKCGDADYLMTFRQIPKGVGQKATHNIHACIRLNGLYDGNITFYAIETDSPFAPLIIWDIVHTLSVGRVVRFYGDCMQKHILHKKYYKNSFQVVEESAEFIAFQKISHLPIEENRGLDDWTFGIPTGSGDATILNAIVARILEISCRNKEIILCGRPGDNFKYWNQVKIIGEDISAPPVQISKKKNLIAKCASYGNLCILHDRVFLPRDFMDAMKKYGDDYCVTTLQSIYFDDYHNLCPYRYSDLNALLWNEVSGGVYGINSALIERSKVENYAFNPNLLDITERLNDFYYQNPLRTTEKTYATGSLYIVKKSLWTYFPLDEQLKWEDFEDVAWGLYGSYHGIPHRVNPWSFSQSILARVLMLPETGIAYFNSAGKIRYFSSIRTALKVKHKPLLKCTESIAWDKIFLFKKKYCPNIQISAQSLTSEYRLQVILQMLNAAQFELEQNEIHQFLNDVESLLLQGTFSHSFKQYMYEHFVIYGGGAMVDIMNNPEFRTQLGMRLGEKPFAEEMTDYGVEDGISLKMGSALSAMFFAQKNGQLFYHPDGYKGFYRSILNSTPYKRYFVGDVE